MSRWPQRIYAHRGANAELPENTLPAFARAVAVGCNALETDAHLTADGVVILAHDATSDRTSDQSLIWRKASWDRIQALDVARMPGGPASGGPYRVPTLEQLLSTFPGVHVNVDLKAPGDALARETVAVVRRCNADARVTLTSFSLRTIVRLRRAGWRGELGLSRPEAALVIATPPPFDSALVRVLGAPRAAQLPLTALGRDLTAPAFIAKLHAVNLRCDFWTVNDVPTAQRLFAAGADGIMTDDPATIIKGLGEALR